MGKLPPAVLQLVVLREVNARADVTEKRAIRRKARYPAVEDPAIFSVVSLQAILEVEWLPRVEETAVGVRAASGVLRMHAFGPPDARFLLESPAGESEPAFVDKRARFVRPRHPDHHRCRVGNRAKARL